MVLLCMSAISNINLLLRRISVLREKETTPKKETTHEKETPFGIIGSNLKLYPSDFIIGDIIRGTNGPIGYEQGSFLV